MCRNEVWDIVDDIFILSIWVNIFFILLYVIVIFV